MYKKIILFAGFTTLLLLLYPPFVFSQNNNSYQNEMCVVVKLKIEQDIVFERQGFKAELNLTNEQLDLNITNVRIKIEFRDVRENIPANELFFVQEPTLTNLTGGIDGEGVILGGKTANITWLIIPKYLAGGTLSGGRQYGVKAIIEYQIGGIPDRIDTWEDFITVQPMPMLSLEYALPFKVLGDNPFTPLKEDIIPFVLGLRIKNSGQGSVYNFQVASQQPEIVYNPEGFTGEFRLLGVEFGGKFYPNNLTINFEEMQGQTTLSGGWTMTSSVTGIFSEFSATYKHSETLGGDATSLIEKVSTLTLIKDIAADVDNLVDFLITSEDRYELKARCDIFADKTINDPCPQVILIPEKILLSGGGEIGVLNYNQTTQIITYPISPDYSLILEINTTLQPQPNNWLFTYIDDPLLNIYKTYKIFNIVREDGKEINNKNYWMQGGKIFLVDNISSTYKIGYTINFEIKEEPDKTPPTISELQIVNCKLQNGKCYINYATPTISAKITDDKAGVDESSLKLVVGSLEFITSYDKQTNMMTATTTEALSDGDYEGTLSVKDLAGNLQSLIFNLVIDTQPPVISNITPPQGSIVTIQNPLISAQISDILSGINATSLLMKLNDESVLHSYDNGYVFLATEQLDLQDGEYKVQVSLSDNAGNIAETGWSFTVLIPPKQQIEKVINRLEKFKQEINTSQVKRENTYTAFIDVVIILLDSAIKSLEKEHKNPAVAKIVAAQKILQVMIDIMPKDKKLPSDIRQTWTEKCNLIIGDLQKIIDKILPQRAKEEILAQDKEAQDIAQNYLSKYNLTDIDLTLQDELNLIYAYNYPNPYRGTTPEMKARGKSGATFRYRASGDIQRVVIEVYNLAGRLVDKFEDTTIDGEVNWGFADRLSNGVYIYRITITDGRKNIAKTGKMVVVR